jgi:ABC-type uncharacterized transport system substrate-binding protein
MDPSVVLAWTTQAVRVPTLGFFDFGIEGGLLIGQTESGFEHGECVANFALKILRGTPPSSIPVRKANVGILLINRDAASRLQIQIPVDLLAEANRAGEE